MALEEKLTGWTAPSSDTEQEKQERTERMVREAVSDHAPFASCQLSVFAKGSYANNTNVRLNSDVDIAVECRDLEYWDESGPGIHVPGTPYVGPWTPAKLRLELGAALDAKFPGEVDRSGSTAFQIRSGSSRVEADVVPCFSYGYYMPGGVVRRGTKIFTTSLGAIVNYPDQQLKNGIAKNKSSGYAYKKAVRLLKRVGDAMSKDGVHKGMPSYFVECLVYNCPDSSLMLATWTAVMRQILVDLWERLKGEEPTAEPQRMLEVNECLFLFPDPKWSRAEAREFVQSAWNYLEFK